MVKFLEKHNTLPSYVCKTGRNQNIGSFVSCLGIY